MIVDERLVTYINSLDTGNTAMLNQIEREDIDCQSIYSEGDAEFFEVFIAM